MDNKKEQSPFAVLWKWAEKYHGGFYLAVVTAVIGVAGTMFAYISVAQIIRILIGNGSISECTPWIIGVAAGYLVKAVCSTVSTAFSHTATYHTLRDLRERMLKKLSLMPMGVILDTPSGQYKTTIVDRVEGMEPTLAHLIPEMTANIVVPVAIAVFIFAIDWSMGLASLVTTIVGMIAASGSGKTYAKRWEGAVKVGKDMANSIVEYIGGIQVVKAFSQSAGSYHKYAGAVNANAAYFTDWMKDSSRYMTVMQTFIPSILITILPVGGFLCNSGSLSAADFFTVIVLSLGFTGPFLAAMSFVDELAVVGTNVKEINSILEAPELVRPQDKAELKSEEIVLNDVSFAYKEGQDNVLNHINLDIKPGTVTALVGPSGSGKSTIAKLVAGFFDVTSGSISIGGSDIKNIPLSQLNQQIAYVSQDNYLFNRSVRDNIRMGKSGATDKDVEEVAKAAGCDEFIRALDNGYDTVCGGGGGHLSGGEKQRISIARAMLKDAPIVILDEATASIDPENEAIIQQAISRLTKGKTLIVIAHRLGTIANADNIVVVQNGSIKAQGKQEKLLSECPLYADMWRAYLGSRDLVKEDEA